MYNFVRPFDIIQKMRNNFSDVLIDFKKAELKKFVPGWFYFHNL